MKTLKDAAHGLEAVLLRQMLKESGVFKSQDSGAHVYGDFFVDAIAEAVEKSGGLGIANVLERSLGPNARPAQMPASFSLPGASALTSTTLPHMSPAASTLSQREPGPQSNDHAGVLEALVLAGKGHQTSAFGVRADPFTGTARFHDGVDLGAERGSPIQCAASGVVTFAGPAGGYGLMVEVDHGDGLVTRYAHADRLDVKVGQRVDEGMVLGAVGSTGRSTGPHLHLEARLHGRSVDPSLALKRERSGVE